MSSTNSRSQPKLPVNLPCKECRRAKQKCDRVSPACNRCVKRGSNCVFPQSRGVRDSPAASQQRELSPSVELQVIKEERQFLSVSNATSTMNSTTFSPLSNPLRDLQGRVASLFGSVPASWGSKLATAQPELTKPRALRSNNANPVDLSLSKRQKSNNVLIPAVQAYNVERPQTPPRKRVCISGHHPFSLLIRNNSRVMHNNSPPAQRPHDWVNQNIHYTKGLEQARVFVAKVASLPMPR